MNLKDENVIPKNFSLKKNNILNNISGENLVLSDYNYYQNTIYQKTKIVGIKKLAESLKEKCFVFLDNCSENLSSLKNNHFLINNLAYKILFSNFDNLSRSNKIVLYYFQILLHIFLLSLLKTKKIIVTHQHKYWQIILAARFLNIQSFHFMHGVIFIGSRDNSQEILNKNILSLPPINIHPTKIGLKQLNSITLKKNKHYFLEASAESKQNLNNSEKIITIIGSWFVNDKNNKKYTRVLKKLVDKVKKDFENYNLYYLKHILMKESNHTSSISGLKELTNNSILLKSERTISFFSTLSIELYENYNISPTFVALDSSEEIYLKKICESIDNSAIMLLS